MIITDEKVLRKKSHNTTIDECNTYNIFIRLENELARSDGLGLSAIQIGFPLRACIIRAKLNKPVKMINPSISRKIDPIRVQGEGCLSLPGIYVDTLRYKQCVVSWQDETGKSKRAIFTDLEAVVIQHECHHFDGILITDCAI